MTATTIACISITGAGLLMVLISIPFFIREKTLIKKCTAKTTGTVVEHKFNRTNESGVSFTPIVEFMVNGRIYKAHRHYRGIAARRIKNNKRSIGFFHISDNDVFHIRSVKGFTDYASLAQAAWPLGSEQTVLYDPKKPKRAFVEKVVTLSNIVGIVLLSVGGGLIVLASIFNFIFG